MTQEPADPFAVHHPQLAAARRRSFRWTTRRSMMGVAIVAGLLGVGRFLAEALHDDPYYATNTARWNWNKGPSPAIAVDLFMGDIQVLPSPDDRVWAEVQAICTTKTSQDEADQALRSIETHLIETGDSLRITTRGGMSPTVWSRASLSLKVPTGVALDLRTASGVIIVGQDGEPGYSVKHAPIRARSVRARNDSTYGWWYHQGNLIVETAAPTHSDGTPIPTRLDLSGPGQIEIIADLATVDAVAWHGSAPKNWPPGSNYEDGFEGSILFHGVLAAGSHSLRAAHRIDVRLPASRPLRIEAEASGGIIDGDLVPELTSSMTGGRSRWTGTIGHGSDAHLKIRSDDGSIRLNTPSGPAGAPTR